MPPKKNAPRQGNGDGAGIEYRSDFDSQKIPAPTVSRNATMSCARPPDKIKSLRRSTLKSEKPREWQEVDRLAGLLRSHLAKRGVPSSLRNQLAGLLRNWVRWRTKGSRTIYPGNTRMAEWAGCKKRQAKTNVSILEEAGILKRALYEKGGRNRATQFQLSARAIRCWLIANFNPSPRLIEGLRNLERYDLHIPTIALVRLPKNAPQKGAV